MSGGVRKIAQVAVGAVVGFVSSGGNPLGALAGAGLAFYMAEQQEKLNTKSPLRDNEPSAQTVRSSKAPARFILGRVSTGGVLVWAQEQVGTQTDGEWLHLVYVLCEGAVDGLEEIYLGEEEIATYGEFASYELIVNPTQVNAFLKANCPDWKDEQIGRGLSFVRLSLKYSAEKFPSGIPDARFIVRGRNDIYDPRTGMAVYTENTALHILWFLRNRCGVPDDEIVFETFASGANVCDESVGNPDGTTSPRYRSSCVIGADEQRTSVLQKLETACGGRTIRVGGRWMFQAGAYYGPYDFEITEDMVVGTITGSTEPTNDAAINTVRGTFIDTSQSWTETDYPEVSIAEWVIEDGGEAAETLAFSYVTDAYQAQRLANIELRRRRAGGTISVPMNFLGYNCRPGRAVRVNLPSLNILGEFIVTNWSMGANEGCTAQLQQYDAPQFDDAVGQPYNPIGFINLPTGGLGSPTNVAWTPGDIAEVTQGVLSWLQPAGIVTAYAVTVRQGGTAVQAQQVPATTLQLPLAGLPSGNYTMSVAALGPLTRSGEASITVNIDGPPIPESCVVQATIDAITLIPGNTLHGLNGGTYEYFFSTNPQATQGDYLGQGLSLTHTGLAFATNYAYFVRSRNAYGVSAFLKVVASTSTDVENMLGALKDKIENGQLAPVLREEIALISGPPTLPGSVSARLKEVNDQLQEQIDAIGDVVDALEYDPAKAYTSGENVRQGQRLYVAIKAVPAAVGGDNAPPNPTYWLDIGQVVRTENGTAARVSLVETKVTEQEGKLTAESKRIDSVQTSLNGKANASTVDAIANRVTQTEQGLTTQGSALTGLTNQIGNIGGDNLLPNSSFEEPAVAGRAKYWLVTHASIGSLVDSTLSQSAKAQRVSQSALAAGAYIDIYFGGDGIALTKVRAGGQYALSTFARGTPGQRFAQYIQFLNASGAVLAAPTAQAIVTGEFARYVLLATAPTGAVSCRVYAGRLVNIGSTAADLWMEVDNVQLQEGAVATAYAPSTEQSIAGQAAATQALTTKVEQNEAGLSSQGTALTNLNNSLSTTNGNVTAAQQAAQAAATAAGAKGEVIYGSAALPADKRLAQNLWIDTTGNANTPKRWNGTAWVAVTDKVATDAAAAAASALSQVATKAEASVVQALSSEVTQHGNTLTSQSQSITEMRNSIGNIGAGGLDGAPGGVWQFDTSVEGWTATNATLTAGTGSMTITATANDPNLVSPVVSINGALYSRIKAKITRRAGTAADWDSSLFYQTTAHGFSGSYIGRATNPNIAIGESAIVEWDMAKLFTGGNDWVTSTITRLRIDIGALSGGAFEVDWIAVGRQGPGASAAALQQVSSNVTQQGEQLTAQASRLDGIYVQVNPEMEGDSSGMAGQTGSFVGVWTEQSARVEEGIATGRKVETVQSQVGEVSASVQIVSETVASVDGKVSAMSSWKTETNSNGKKVATGIVQGNNGGVGEILLMAQRLAIIDGLDGQMILPFVVQNGQVFINQAIISQAFIKEIILGMTLKSAAVNSQGLPLLEINVPAGTLTLRGQTADGSVLLNNYGLYVYDLNYIERTGIGRMT